MKLLFCGFCQGIISLASEKKYCPCGKSWGHYLEDNYTTVQTTNTLSLGLANPDFHAAVNAFNRDAERFSPELAIRMWINPLSEKDVTYVDERPILVTNSDGGDG